LQVRECLTAAVVYLEPKPVEHVDGDVAEFVHQRRRLVHEHADNVLVGAYHGNHAAVAIHSRLVVVRVAALAVLVEVCGERDAVPKHDELARIRPHRTAVDRTILVVWRVAHGVAAVFSVVLGTVRNVVTERTSQNCEPPP